MKKYSLIMKSLFFTALLAALVTGCSSADVNGIESTGNHPVTTLISKNKLLVKPVVTAVVNGTSVTVTWDAVENSVGYQVVFSGSNDIPGIQPPDHFTGLSVTRDGIVPGNYTVSVRALSDPGDPNFQNSEFSDEFAFTIESVGPVKKVPLAAPVITVITHDASATTLGEPVTVSWTDTDSAQVAGYLFAIDGGTPFTLTSAGFDISTLTPGDHTVTVQAIAPAGSVVYINSSVSSAGFIVKRKLNKPVVLATVSYSAPFITGLTASQTSIWPVNKAMVPVTFSGTVYTGKGNVSISWTDIDALIAAGYSVTFDGSAVATQMINNVTIGLHTISVIALAGSSLYYLNSDAGTATVDVHAGSAVYQLIDEYPAKKCGNTGNGELKQVVCCSVGPLPFLSPVTLFLQAWRYGQDLDGRHYLFTVTVKNGDNSSSAKASVTVIVPHDQKDSCRHDDDRDRHDNDKDKDRHDDDKDSCRHDNDKDRR